MRKSAQLVLAAVLGVAAVAAGLALATRGAAPEASASATRPAAWPTTPARPASQPVASYPAAGGPAVAGDAAFVEKVGGALRLLAEKSPEEFAFVVEQVRLFRQAEPSGTHVADGLCVVDLGGPTAGASVAWVASVLVHESNHNKQYRDALATGRPVDPAAYTGVAAERACNAVQLIALRRVGGTAAEIEHLSRQDGGHFDVDGDGDYDWDDYRLRKW